MIEINSDTQMQITLREGWTKKSLISILNENVFLSHDVIHIDASNLHKIDKIFISSIVKLFDNLFGTFQITLYFSSLELADKAQSIYNRLICYNNNNNNKGNVYKFEVK